MNFLEQKKIHGFVWRKLPKNNASRNIKIHKKQMRIFSETFCSEMVTKKCIYLYFYI